MRLLLTGAGGFFGRNLIERLSAAPSERHDELDLHITTRRPSHEPGGPVTSHQVDLLHDGSVRDLMSAVRPTHLCHLAWVGPEHADRYRTPENHRWVAASKTLFEAFRDLGGQRLVHLGSCIEYGNRATGVRTESQPLEPDTAYGQAKAELSAFVEDMAGDLSAAVARPFFCYGPHEQRDRLVPSLILALREGRSIDLTEGRQRRDYLDVRDVAGALVALLSEPAAVGAFNIGAGTGVEVRSIAEQLGRVAGRPELLRFGARPEGADSAAEIVADIGRITGTTGWTPTITLEQGLKHATDWWMARDEADRAPEENDS